LHCWIERRSEAWQGKGRKGKGKRLEDGRGEEEETIDSLWLVGYP